MNCIRTFDLRSTYLFALFLVLSCLPLKAQWEFSSNYFKVHVSKEGFITSMQNITVSPMPDFSPADKPSPLLSLYSSDKEEYLEPQSAIYYTESKTIELRYPNESVAKIKVISKEEYIKLTLMDLSPREGIDGVQWGPYHTSITNLLGEIIGVARDTSDQVNYAIGMLALDDNTLGGTSETIADAAPFQYIIHTPDPVNFPLPTDLHEGQVFTLGGDGISDVAFYSHKEPYYRIMYGNAAMVDRKGRISLAYHSRDRRFEREVAYSLIPNMPANTPNHLQVQAVPGVDYIGSSIALWGSPDSTALLDVIQNIVLSEGLPYPTINGKWVKDPAAYLPDAITSGGVYDSIISYTSRLGFKAISLYDQGFIRPDRGNNGYLDGQDFERKPIHLSSGNLSHKEFSERASEHGIMIGRTPITTALAPGTMDASPIPSDSLCYQQKRILAKSISSSDTIILIDDPKYMDEIASWEGHAVNLNMIKIGKELIHYLGVSATEPYRLLNVKRGYWDTEPANHEVNDTIYKLQVTLNYGYDGVIPNMDLQDKIAEYYADVCQINGLGYYDFDGQEFLFNNGHGYYSAKRFFRKMFEKAETYGLPSIRFTGATLSEGSWHYQSIWNVGGGKNMYDAETREWGSTTSQGKDLRDVTYSNFFPASMGGNFPINATSTVELYEHVQAISVGVGSTYSLRLNQNDVESCPDKDSIFKLIRIWEDARAANAFPRYVKKLLADPANNWTLEQGNDADTWKLYRIIDGTKLKPLILERSQDQTIIRSHFISQLNQGDTLTIGALGTSLTGGQWRWFDVMKEWLDEQYPGQVIYHNLGVGASASSHPEGSSGIEKAKEMALLKPDVVFIEFAVNDAYIPYGISVDQSRKNLKQIIQSLQSSNPKVEIILQTMNSVLDLPEKGYSEQSKRKNLDQYLRMYREFASQQGLLLIDHYRNWQKYLALQGRRAYLKLVPDGIHPNLEGYRRVLLPELKEVLCKKWIPVAKNQNPVFDQTNSYLKDILGHVELLACKFDGSKLLNTSSFQSEFLVSNEAKWRCSAEASLNPEGIEHMDLSINVRLEDGQTSESGIALSFNFNEWNPKNYVLLPASVYDGNRHKIVNRGYAEGLDRKYLYQEDNPTMSVPIPHLSESDKTLSRLEVNSSNMATPAMCFFNKEEKKGFVVLSEQKSQFGDHAFTIEESPDRKNASFVISAPGVRQLRPLFVGYAESTDRGADLMKGDELNLKFKIYALKAHDIPEFLEQFSRIRKSLTGQNQPRNLTPFSQIKLWMTQRIDERWYENDQFGYYCPENANWISFGWIGGLINTFPMLALEDKYHFKRVASTFDFAIPRAQGAAGYFYGAIDHKGVPFSRDGYPEIAELALTRKNGDVLYWMIKQFQLLEDSGRKKKIKKEWEQNIQKLADGFVTSWNKYRQWGKTINTNTGQVAEYGTTGGAMAIGGLALASIYYDEPSYLKTARDAAHFYYQRDFLQRGYTNGGCADILHNADSESAAAFMTSLMTLYEICGDPSWLKKCEDLAHLCATWTTSYDYELPIETELGKLDAKLTGVYWASTQNKHGAPGICTNSGDALFKLFRATKDIRYADLLNDIIHAYGESIREGGYTNERLTYCDAESRGERGQHVTGWNELNGFLMALEIPGIYINTDSKEHFVFDHVEVRNITYGEQGIELEIYNPTAFDAEVSIFSETGQQSSRSLGENAYIHWPKVKVASKRMVKIGRGN